MYNNYKLPVFRTNFLKLKFWKLLSNSYCLKQLSTLKTKICYATLTLISKIELLVKNVYVQNKHKANKTKTKSMKLKLLKRLNLNQF